MSICNKIEKEGLSLIDSHFKKHKVEFEYIEDDITFQKTSGDYKLITPENYLMNVITIPSFPKPNIEIKTEQTSKWGNIFWETWSDETTKRPGWTVNLVHCDILYYIFLNWDTDNIPVVYVADFKVIKNYIEPNILKYKEKTQHAVKQWNKTVGRVVPIKELLENKIIYRIKL